MTDDIMARLRVLASKFQTVNGWMDNEWTNAAEEIERLRDLIEGHHYLAIGQRDQMKRLRAERDEARREVCAFVSGRYRKDVVTLDRAAALEEAKRRGWDCFKGVNE